MNRPPSPRDPQVVEDIDTLIRTFGGDTEQLHGELARELIQAALALLQDRADTGEMKLVSRSFRELRYALKVFRRYRDRRKVSVFGSARTGPEHADYDAARRFSKEMAGAGWMVITGAGGGIMRAGNEGAGRERSFGASIRLPFETNANDIIAGDEKLVTFRYFFTRKLIFVSQADALVLFPGGFGTLDECFEVLTLVQTGKAPMIPVVMIEPAGSTYWRAWDRWLREQLVGRGMVAPEDSGLYFITPDPREAQRHVLHFYRNFHSLRSVGDQLVLRLQQPLTEPQVGALNTEFSDLLAEGRIQQRRALPDEAERLDLPRLALTFTKRDYGRLRRLIDRVNEMV